MVIGTEHQLKRKCLLQVLCMHNFILMNLEEVVFMIQRLIVPVILLN